MIDASYAFAHSLLPVGTEGPTDLLVRFHPTLAARPRRRLNLSLVIDRSGSMAGANLKHALDAAQAVIDMLEAEDIISVVVFDDVVSTIIAPQPPLDKVALKQQLRAVRAGGTTNLSGGWLEGCKHVKAHYDPQAINRVLLLTDGQANEGVTDKRILTGTATQKAEDGIVTTTLGFGSWFEEDLLVGMARAAGGNFYFIQSRDDATEVFTIELDTIKSVIAQNLTVHLTPAATVAIEHCLTLARAERQAETTTLNLGDLFDGEDKLLGLTLNLPRLDRPGVCPVVRLRYSVDVIQDDRIQTLSGELDIAVPTAAIEDVAGAPPTGMRLDIARLKIAHAKELALGHADRQQYKEAESVLRLLIDELHRQGLHEKFEIAEEIEQLGYFAGRFASKDLSSETRKELRDQSFQGLNRGRHDLTGRGTETGAQALALSVVADVGTGVELVCVREGGKLRIHVRGATHDNSLNVQFPRAMRAEGARYVVDGLEPAADGSFYRVQGAIRRLVRAGETDQLGGGRRGTVVRTGKASKAPATLADLEVTSAVGDGILVQCVKDGSKLRARVVSDGFEPTWNMRFPRSIREDGILYVADEVITAPDGKSYIACGKIRRFEQV